MISSFSFSLAVNSFSSRRVTSMNSVSWLSCGNYIPFVFCFSLYIGSWNLHCVSFISVYYSICRALLWSVCCPGIHSFILPVQLLILVSQVILQRFLYLYIAGHSFLKQSENRKWNVFMFVILCYLWSCCLCIKVLWYQSSYGLPKISILWVSDLYIQN